MRFVAGNLFADDLGNGFDLVLFFYNPGGENEEILEILKAIGVDMVQGYYIGRPGPELDNTKH